MHMTFPRFLIISLGLILTACSGLTPAIATATPPQPTSTPLPTATIIWFPPTATQTPQPVSTQPPTPDLLSGLGQIIASDHFSDTSTWSTASSDKGSASIDRERLTIAVQPGVYLLSLQQNLVLDNFYAELTIRPALCRGADSYGMLVRANAVTYYRFSLYCNGTASAERISRLERHVLHEPVPSGDVPPGAPGEVRLGVWAFGSELRLFLNDRYQFSITDMNLSSGTVGAFAFSSGDTPVTVTFSDLVVRAVEFAPVQGTAQP
ncbi:MAG: hypothetical protein Kow002_10120 [Anaerolineales bacterium]